MATIDSENAKQIRQPMDVIIKVTIEESANLTYTHSNTAKIADDVLDEPDWAMRKLADLQGDGFELDASAHVYDSDVPPSLSNGKIGVRTVVAAPVIITVTSDTALNYITVKAEGASYVTYDNVDYSLTSGYAIIPVGGQTNFSMEFVGESIYKRVEVSDILPGIWLEITNENLISAVVSLRSDLSIIEPTLPESEINVEVYYDDDISEILAAIPDETPLTYQAGYPGDMSPVRKFYISEQITWADNVITIHAVDAVHKLDNPIGTALYMVAYSPSPIANTAMGLIEDRLGITIDVGNPYLRPGSTQTKFVVDEGFTVREFIAQVHEFLHQEDDLWYTYVDAGIPSFTWHKPTAVWDINENDCGDVQRNTERAIASIKLQHRTVRQAFANDAGTASLIRNVGVSLSFNSSYVIGIAVGIASDTRDDDLVRSHYSSVRHEMRVVPLVPVTADGKSSTTSFPHINHSTYAGMTRMLRDGVAQDDFSWIGGGAGSYSDIYTQFIPWACSYDANDSYWNDNPGAVDIQSQATARTVLTNSGIIDLSVSDADIAIGGYYYNMEIEPRTFSSGNNGIDITIDNPPWFGSTESDAYGEDYPTNAYNSILSRSNVTGSFTWKGDPRMQPRDVVTFHRLDGTTEEITLENITLTHEGGGTVAEITYRKGVV